MKNYYLRATSIGALCMISLLLGSVMSETLLAKVIAVCITVVLYSLVRALIAAIPVGTKFRVKRWARRFRRTSYFR